MSSKIEPLVHPKSCADKKKQFAIVVGSACGVGLVVGIAFASAGAATKTPVVSPIFLLIGVVLIIGAVVGLGVGFGYEYKRVCTSPAAIIAGPSGALFL